MKEVKRSKKIRLKTKFLLDLLSDGKTPAQISKKLGISKQNVYYYTSVLKKRGIIKKLGYGVWEVKKYTSNTLSKTSKKIRGHAFIWKVKLHKEYDWIKILAKYKIHYKLVRSKTPRIIINNKKIWLGKKTIVIYEVNSFYGVNSIESKKYAVISLIELLESIQNRLRVNLTPHTFSTSREHYGMIKNELARQYNRKGKKLHIRDNIEGEWLWIDDSEALGELETGQVVRSKQVQDWWNNHKEHNFKVTPSFLMESLSKLTLSQIESSRQLTQFNHQINEHLKLIKEYRKENVLWRKHKVKEIRKDLREGKQTRLPL